MLIDFSVTNFRSIKDEQLLSLHAAKPGTHLFRNMASGNDKVATLKSCAIYGPNASGKSNLLRAFNALSAIVAGSGDLKDGEEITQYSPYMFDLISAKSPTVFEAEFIIGINRFIYKISFDRYRIYSETLDYFPSRQKANIFARRENDTWDTISFGSHLKGGTRKIPLFKNNSYLSKAGNNASTPDMIREVYTFFRSFTFLQPGIRPTFVGAVYESPAFASIISKLISLVDTGIAKITYEDDEPIDSFFSGSEFTPELFEAIKKSRKFKFWHEHNGGDLHALDFQDESMGTRRLFSVLPQILLTLWTGNILIMDEIETSLHPHIVKLVIELFHDPVTNPRNAQIIFTTHDVSLLTPDIFRRDQIWFVSKENAQSNLKSLDDFDKKQVTAHSPFGEWYDDGRFGSIPEIEYGLIAEEVANFMNKAEAADA
jgi:AAA15 family ATPase/GTPase